MGKNNWYGAELHNLNFTPAKGGLEAAVMCLPPAAKQAFYSAAMRKGIIHRSTWNGCAFNAGGVEVGINGITSHQKAAEAFGCTTAVVSKFIQAWDNSPYTSDEAATRGLLELLEKVGIFSDPDQPKVVRIYRKVIVEGNMTDAELLKDFQAEIADLDAVIDGWAEAHELLFKETVSV
jgi:hypothetical protein